MSASYSRAPYARGISQSNEILVLVAAGLLIWLAAGSILAFVAGGVVVFAAAVTGARAAQRRINGFAPADTLLGRCSRWVPGGVALVLAVIGFVVTMTYRGDAIAQLFGTTLFLFHVTVVCVAARPDYAHQDERT